MVHIAYNISTVYKWHSGTITGHTDPQERERPGIKRVEQLLVHIAQVLEAKPYASVRNIAHNLCETPSIVWRYITQELHLQYKTSRWIPHTLKNEQKKERMEKAKALYEILIKSQHETFANILTGDE